MRSQWGLFLALILTIFLADQASKALVIRDLSLYQSITPIPALSDYFRITHSYNTGAAFGIFPQSSDAFLWLSVVIVIGLLVYSYQLSAHAILTRCGIALIVGGALGNIADRIAHGHVTDFIHYTIGGISNISNIADHAVVIGVIVVIVDSFRLDRLEKRQNAKTEEISTDS